MCHQPHGVQSCLYTAVCKLLCVSDGTCTTERCVRELATSRTGARKTVRLQGRCRSMTGQGRADILHAVQAGHHLAAEIWQTRDVLDSKVAAACCLPDTPLRGRSPKKGTAVVWGPCFAWLPHQHCARRRWRAIPSNRQPRAAPMFLSTTVSCDASGDWQPPSPARACTGSYLL